MLCLLWQHPCPSSTVPHGSCVYGQAPFPTSNSAQTPSDHRVELDARSRRAHLRPPFLKETEKIPSSMRRIHYISSKRHMANAQTFCCANAGRNEEKQLGIRCTDKHFHRRKLFTSNVLSFLFAPPTPPDPAQQL